jgi:hypothetical protein
MKNLKVVLLVIFALVLIAPIMAMSHNPVDVPGIAYQMRTNIQECSAVLPSAINLPQYSDVIQFQSFFTVDTTSLQNGTFMSNLDPLLCIAPIAAIGTFNIENLKVITQDRFLELQAKHGKLYILDVVIDETESYQFVLRRPDRATLEAIEANSKDTAKVNDMIIKNLLVSDNAQALDDGIVYAQFMAQSAKIIRQGSAFLSKA